VSDAARARLLALTAHARDVPADERARFAAELAARPPDGSVRVVTCHRVEWYGAAGATTDLSGAHALLPSSGRARADDDAARHLLTVAVGRDSAVLGEDAILHQLREALQGGEGCGPVDPAVRRLFTIALSTGRRVRSWEPGRRRSLGDVALDRIVLATGDVRGRRILVVGAGRMGGLAARAALHAGARVAIANRTADRGRALASDLGADVVPFDPGPFVGGAWGVVVATSGPWTIAASTVEALLAGRAVVIDLSFPPAVPPEVGLRLGDRLVGADALAAGTGTGPIERDDRHDRIAREIESGVDELHAWMAGGSARATAAALTRRADALREAELDALWRRVPTLEPEARAAIERMSRHLAKRLLQPPLERLGRDRDGRDAVTIRDVFSL
jgi:glutamyl-tRNA reductase